MKLEEDDRLTRLYHHQAPELMDIWITKYALTDGVWLMKGVVKDNMATCVWENAPNGVGNFHGVDWNLTEADAMARVEDMKKAKLKSLNKKIKQIEAYKFTVKPVG